MESLHDIAYKINTFVLLVKKISKSELNRISDSLLEFIKFVVQSDIHAMRNIFEEYDVWVKLNRFMSVEKNQYFWDELFATLPAITSLENVTDVTNLRNKQTLSVYQEILLPINLYSKANVNNSIEGEPNNDEVNGTECLHIYNEIREILRQTESFNNSHRGDDVSTSTGQYSPHVVNNLYQNHIAYNCVDEIGNIMNDFVKELQKISMDVANILQITPGIDEDGFWDILESDLNGLNAISISLSEQISSYAANETTKMKLSNFIGQNMVSDVEFLLDRIISVITIKGIDPLLERVSELNMNTHSWYKKALEVLQTSVPSYEDRGVKSLHIWRHPVALLETEDILKFKYGVSDTWRSWEMSTSLDDFIISGDAKRLILNVTKEFSNTLHLELMRIKTQFRNARHKVLGSFAEVISHFTDIQREGSTGEKFML